MLKHMPTGPASAQNRPSRGLNRSIQPLNVSTLSTATTTTSGLANGQATKYMNGGPRMSFTTPLPSVSSNSNNNNNNNSNSNNINANHNNNNIPNNLHHHHPNLTNINHPNKDRIGAREALTSLGLLCLVSLLLALLSLIFLLKISPGGRDPPPPPPGPTAPEDYAIVYDVTLALCALSLSLNLCCLLVCAIQFLFAVKLVRAPATTGRGNKYLQKSSVSRVCAVGGFFISIPIFLTGIILYTFTQFHSTPAIITSILIGVGIVFCGCAMVHNVFVWQREKTISVRQIPLNLNLSLSPNISAITPPAPFLNHSISNNNNNNSTSNNNNNNHPTYNNIHSNGMNGVNHNLNNHHHHHHHHSHNNNNSNNNHNHTPLTHTSQISHTTPIMQLTPVTPLSGNHSHISFNHSSYLPSYGMRAATATPPTPKISGGLLSARDASASGSVSPGMPTSATLDLSNITATNSPHELSTLV